MQQKLTQRMTRLLAAAGAALLLTQAAWAAAYEVPWDETCQLHSEDFTAGQTVDGILIRSVPTAADGSFCYGSRALRAGDVLPASALDAITLRPAAQRDGELALTYCPIVEGTLGSQTQLTVAVSDGKTEPPVAKDGKLETYRNIANNGTLQVEGGAEGAMTYQLVRTPKRGEVSISEDGTFLYTPKENKVGTDRFTYTATDAAGNVSNEATVTVRILKAADAAAYADLDSDYDQFEAMWLRASGLFSGRELGGQACFEPNATLSRGEFLVMAMQVAGLAPDAVETVSGFSDEGDAPAWMRPYLSAALRCGVVSGIPASDGLLFAPKDVYKRQDVDIIAPDKGKLRGKVTSVTFMGVHNEAIVDIDGFKWMIQTTDPVTEGAYIGITLEPDAIHIMKKSEYSGLFGDYSSFSNELDELSNPGEEEDA